MPRDPQTLIFVGIKHSVVALDDRTGTEVWRTDLRSGDYVTVLWDGEALIAGNSGEVWRLDPAKRTSDVAQRAERTRTGAREPSVAPGGQRPTRMRISPAEKRRRDAAAAAAAEL